jgi:hypothetical protein
MEKKSQDRSQNS